MELVARICRRRESFVLSSESTPTSSALQIFTVTIIAIVFLLLTLAGVLVFVLAFILFEFYRDLVNGLVPNGFGLCTGGHAAGVPNDEPWLMNGFTRAYRRQPARRSISR